MIYKWYYDPRNFIKRIFFFLLRFDFKPLINLTTLQKNDNNYFSVYIMAKKENFRIKIKLVSWQKNFIYYFSQKNHLNIFHQKFYSYHNRSFKRWSYGWYRSVKLRYHSLQLKIAHFLLLSLSSVGNHSLLLLYYKFFFLYLFKFHLYILIG